MNDAYLHLLLNHFPITGTIFGVLILLAGLFIKKRSVEDVAYAIFILSALFAVFSTISGEGAEDIVEKMPGVDKHLIHEHEEIAEKFAFALYALGFVSLLGLYTNISNKGKSKLIHYLALAVALLAVYFAKETGTSGGVITHNEIMTNTPTQIDNHEAEDD